MNEKIKFPHNLGMERGILDIFLEFPEYRDEILIKLKPKWFYWDIHREIYNNFVKIFAQKNALDVTLLHKNVTDKHYSFILQNILNKADSGAPYPAYIRELRELYRRREMIKSCLKIIQSPDLSYKDQQEIVASSLDMTDENVNWEKLNDTILKYDSEEAYLSLTESFLKTKIKYFQQNVIAKRGDLIILAGRPSMGKTAFCLELGKQNAKCEQKVGLISCEMLSPYLLKRLAHSESLQTGFEGYIDGCKKLFNLPFWIEDGSRRDINSIHKKIQVLMKKVDADVIYVDYLGLLQHPGKESRTMEVTYISGFLKEMAKKYNIPIVALSQLSRKLEDRADKKPQLGDLRDSGAIEQDADIVLFCYRPFEYDNNSDKEDISKEFNLTESSQKEYFELVIAKQRDYAKNSLSFRYIPERNYFTTWDTHHETFRHPSKVVEYPF